jgi:3-hydroxyisobutyrate dehydrogenase-like beta-hydroxyacid dehydrogenase
MRGTVMKKVGVIGLGNMGRPIARNIVQAGFEVAVFDINEAAVRTLVGHGATGVERPADVAMGADLVITVLPDGPDVERVALGEDGVFTSGREGMIHADFSTVHPNVSRTLAAEGKKRGIRVLDAAMARSVAEAEKGELVLMVGGDGADLDACRPVFEKIATDIHHCGPNGTGSTMKLVNNMLGGVIAAVCAESLLLGVKAGLSTDVMMQVLSTTGANSAMLQGVVKNKMLTGAYEPPSFALNLQYKDARLALDLASDVGASLPVGALVQQLRSVARSKGRGTWDTASIATVFEELDGARLTTGS